MKITNLGQYSTLFHITGVANEQARQPYNKWQLPPWTSISGRESSRVT